MRGSPLNYLGAPILSLQSMLAVLSKAGGELPSVIPDGVYGPETTRAVSAFQRQNGLPENGDPLPDIDLPPAEAGLTPVSRLNASHKTAQEQPDIPAGLFVNPYAPDDLVMTATSKTTAVESESNEAPVPASSPEDAAMQAEFSVAAGLEGPVWGEEEPAESDTAQETNDAAP